MQSSAKTRALTAPHTGGEVRGTMHLHTAKNRWHFFLDWSPTIIRGFVFVYFLFTLVVHYPPSNQLGKTRPLRYHKDNILYLVYTFFCCADIFSFTFFVSIVD